MNVRTRLRRAFTLIEVMVAVTILIILVALATSVMNGMGTARMNNAVFDIAALINAAQLRAISRGSPHYIFVRQTPDGLVRVHLLERPDVDPFVDFTVLNLAQGPAVALAYNAVDSSGATVLTNAHQRDQVILGTSIGPDSGGLAFLDLDSQRIQQNPLPPPFTALSLATPLSNPTNREIPNGDLMVGCNFCINPSGQPYGVLRFNADGTMEVITGNARSGAVIAFAPNTESESGVVPRLLAVSAPAGAAVVF